MKDYQQIFFLMSNQQNSREILKLCFDFCTMFIYILLEKSVIWRFLLALKKDNFKIFFELNSYSVLKLIIYSVNVWTSFWPTC